MLQVTSDVWEEWHIGVPPHIYIGCSKIELYYVQLEMLRSTTGVEHNNITPVINRTWILFVSGTDFLVVCIYFY